ncbi:hypothetical protein HMPREF9120_01689 [Neisseria sp. oral taxon 020 str. F0370]|nr:hypothetical protein HMPREF9120_01689 [Neisseria sp. oral taxon 020 str. F0370]
MMCLRLGVGEERKARVLNLCGGKVKFFMRHSFQTAFLGFEAV